MEEATASDVAKIAQSLATDVELEHRIKQAIASELIEAASETRHNMDVELTGNQEVALVDMAGEGCITVLETATESDF